MEVHLDVATMGGESVAALSVSPLLAFVSIIAIAFNCVRLITKSVIAVGL